MPFCLNCGRTFKKSVHWEDKEPQRKGFCCFECQESYWELKQKIMNQWKVA